MAIDTILAYDATGGGVLAVVPPTSLTIKADGHLVGWFYDGISAEDVTITNANNPNWEAAGFSCHPTSTGAAILPGYNMVTFEHKIPVKKGDVLVLTSTAGANPVYFGLYVEYPGGLAFSMRPEQEGMAYHVTKTTTAGGTNCAAGTLVQGATNITGFGQGRTYTPIRVAAAAAFTTTAFLGMRKLGGANYLFIVPIPLTDVAAAWHKYKLPKGLFTVTQGDAIEIFWASVTGEQPTAKVTFAY
jgi:hypothetical protein